MGGVNYGMGQSVCPQCGSGADVRTVAELFAMLNGAQDGATQQAYPGQQTGPDYPGTYPDYPAQGYQGPDSAGTNPDYPAQGYQGPDSAGTNPDHPYQSYQGPGIPTSGYQDQGPAPGYQGRITRTTGEAARRWTVALPTTRPRRSLTPCSGRPSSSPAVHRQADAAGLRGADRPGA